MHSFNSMDKSRVTGPGWQEGATSTSMEVTSAVNLGLWLPGSHGRGGKSRNLKMAVALDVLELILGQGRMI